MTIQFFWQVPTAGDGRYADAKQRIRGERSDHKPYFQPGVTDPRGRRFNYFDHLHQIAKRLSWPSLMVCRYATTLRAMNPG